MCTITDSTGKRLRVYAHPQYEQPGHLVVNSTSAQTRDLRLASFRSGTILEVISSTPQDLLGCLAVTSGLNTLSKFLGSCPSPHVLVFYTPFVGARVQVCRWRTKPAPRISSLETVSLNLELTRLSRLAGPHSGLRGRDVTA